MNRKKDSRLDIPSLHGNSQPQIITPTPIAVAIAIAAAVPNCSVLVQKVCKRWIGDRLRKLQAVGFWYH
jgi:hypothetical protein